MIYRISTLFAADFLVRHFQLLEGAEVLKIARGTLFFEIARIAAVQKTFISAP